MAESPAASNLSVSNDPAAYGFTTEIRVRLSETDAVGIVFFGSFSTYFDVGRMDYLAHLGLNKMGGAVRDLIPGAVVGHRIAFEAPARYNDQLVLHVRIAALGRTSYTFHYLVTHKRSRQRIARGSLCLVWLDDDFRPTPLPEAFTEVIRDFEGDLLVQ